ncbi:tryptophan dimethylallyltransferase family protein [Solwaraspora sp. WMMD791]|uniref:tryptophan dimethylallyltransferase family protein n=1 Tax=Solwaraspora sp. WMMD791 TaxID=3016086 RepID=UPI00249B7451|nr:tryptophan dimethylallyltransferase family protein [Solwaraspora sp. WMMD791]WFE25290.1 tryptophan dimethylallyltransferase family protein [Solwaraspora sp. WMMD791]
MHGTSLLDRLAGQLTRLCAVVDTDPTIPRQLVADLLGPAATRPVDQPPAWPSDIADDHTPVEYSVAFNEAEPPTLRILAEAQAATGDLAAHARAAYRFLDRQVDRFDLATSRFDAVREVFETDQPRGAFALWYSLVFRSSRRPELKVYFNPAVRGEEHSAALVVEALRKLGLDAAYPMMVDGGLRPGELGRRDQLTFFALDLHDGDQARVKLYVSQYDATADDAVRAATVVDGIDPEQVADFCTTAAGGPGPYARRPLVSSYTFTTGATQPVGYSLYVPIRDYVDDDVQARDRVHELLDRYGLDASRLDPAIDAVTDRPLADGVGLIAHVSLRVGRPRPGITVYLSAEAHQVAAARPGRHRTPMNAGSM